MAGEWTLIRVGTAGFAHVLRAGSRLKLIVDAPGGTRADWRFALKTFPGEVRYDLGHHADHPSSLVLPRIEGGAALSAHPKPPAGHRPTRRSRFALPRPGAAPTIETLRTSR